MVASTSNKEIRAALKTIFYITNRCSYFIFLTNIRNILEKYPQLFVGTWIQKFFHRELRSCITSLD